MICEKDPEILALILFGSYVKKEPFQDIDICLVLFPIYTQNNLIIDKKILQYIGSINNLFDFHVFSRLPLYIRQRVIKEGKIILNKQLDLLTDIYLETIKDFNLFEPHYNTYLQAVQDG